jgi:hypothetical protein
VTEVELELLLVSSSLSEATLLVLFGLESGVLDLSKPMEFVALVGVPALDPEYVLFSYMEVVINPVVAMLLGRGRLGPDGVFLILTAPDPVVSLAALGDRPLVLVLSTILLPFGDDPEADKIAKCDIDWLIFFFWFGGEAVFGVCLVLGAEFEGVACKRSLGLDNMSSLDMETALPGLRGILFPGVLDLDKPEDGAAGEAEDNVIVGIKSVRRL